MKLEDKYNHCLALNIELEEIIEMQNKELMLKDKKIKELEKYKKWYLQEAKSVVGIL